MGSDLNYSTCCTTFTFMMLTFMMLTDGAALDTYNLLVIWYTLKRPDFPYSLTSWMCGCLCNAFLSVAFHTLYWGCSFVLYLPESDIYFRINGFKLVWYQEFICIRKSQVLHSKHNLNITSPTDAAQRVSPRKLTSVYSPFFEYFPVRLLIKSLVFTVFPWQKEQTMVPVLPLYTPERVFVKMLH